MKFSIHKLVLIASSLLSSVSCYINAVCNTGKNVVLKKFTTDTTDLFNKLKEVISCWEMYAKPRFNSSSEYLEYRNCISDLSIPESYDKIIASLYKYNFNTRSEFRNVIKSATKKICSDIENSHAYELDDITRKTYRVAGKFPFGDFKKSSKSILIRRVRNNTGIRSKATGKNKAVYSRGNKTVYNGSKFSSSGSGISQNNYTKFIVCGILIIIILGFIIFINFLRINRNVVPDKLISEIHIEKDAPPVILNEFAPPPYTK